MKPSQKFVCVFQSPGANNFSPGKIYRRILKLTDEVAIRDDEGTEHIMSPSLQVITNAPPLRGVIAQFESAGS